MQMDKKMDFETLRNNGKPEMMRSLIDLKNIFAKQLPKMPKEYIVRLVFDSKHESIVIRDAHGVIFGGVTYCIFEEVHLSEIVFLAISSDHQIKGFGTVLMNQLKSEMQAKNVSFLMTCADNLAIGYFQKQGFHSSILMPSQLYKGYLKDYEGSTLMECLLDDKVDYQQIGEQIRQFRCKLHREIEQKVQNNLIYSGLADNIWIVNGKKIERGMSALGLIPGLSKLEGIEEEYLEVEKINAGSCFRSNCLKIVEQLKNHKSAWAFVSAVKKEEVPDYYELIPNPMWLLKVEEKVNEGRYSNRQEFMADLNLVIANCRSYNQKNTIYYKSSLEMEKYMQQLLLTLRDDGLVRKEGEEEIRAQNAKIKKVKSE